jgi:hypothetical protein
MVRFNRESCCSSRQILKTPPAEIVNGLPVVQHGLWVFDIDPVSAVAHF